MLENRRLNEMEILFLALADKTRLRILNLLREREVCVYLFTEILGEAQPKISRHLAYLRNAKIVTTSREGKLIYYKISHPQDKYAAFILNDLLDWLENQPQMQAEYTKLINRIPNNETAIKNLTDSGLNKYAEPNISCIRKDELEIFLL